jgi:uncharacterized caspase-like protein
MQRLISSILLFGLIAVSLSSAQEAPRRVALLIANSEYANAAALTNPANDARIVGEALRRAGFQQVVVRSNLTVSQFRTSLREFRLQATGAEVALLYYAGHGIEANGRNWLIPTDARLEEEYDLQDEAIDLDRVMTDVSGARVRAVVLDACRNNPFGRSWRGTRSVSRGLAGIEVSDILVIYAAEKGAVALDGQGTNSPFALALARRLPERGLPIQNLGNVVRDDVLSTTNGGQRPFVSASMTGQFFYLVPPLNTATTTAPTGAGPVATTVIQTPDAASVELGVWNGAIAAGTAAAFEEYKRQYPAGRYVSMADNAIGALRGIGPTAARTLGQGDVSTSPSSGRMASRFGATGSVDPSLADWLLGRWTRVADDRAHASAPGCPPSVEFVTLPSAGIEFRMFPGMTGAMARIAAATPQEVMLTFAQPGQEKLYFFRRSGALLTFSASALSIPSAQPMASCYYGHD